MARTPRSIQSVDEFDPDAQFAASGILSVDEDDSFVDLTGYVGKGGGPPPVPAGIYDAIVDEVEFLIASTGRPMLKWTFLLTNPEQGYLGRKQFVNTVTKSDTDEKTESALARVTDLFRTLSPSKDLTQVRFKDYNASSNNDMIGLPCRLKLRTRLYDGRVVNDVRQVLPAAQWSATDTEPR